MISVVFLLAIVQAALLLWAAVHLRAACPQPPRLRPALGGFVALGLAIALAR